MVGIKKVFLQTAFSIEEIYEVIFPWVMEDLDADPEFSSVIRVIFGARYNLILLTASIKHLIKKYNNVYTAFISILKSKLYVGYLIHSLEDTD